METFSACCGRSGKRARGAVSLRRRSCRRASDSATEASWDKLLAVRGEVLRALEAARNAKAISGALEARIVLHAGSDLAATLDQYRSWLPALFIVSQVDELASSLVSDGQKSEAIPGLTVAIRRADGAKCERCWNYSTHVGENADYPTVCERCVKALAEIENSPGWMPATAPAS